MEHQTNTEYGDIIIPASFGITIAAIATIVLLILIVLFISFGTYTRKAHLNGIVMPSTGLAKIIPQYPGYVTSLKVSEGQHVTAGQPIYLISGERYNDKGIGTLEAMTLSVKTQYSMLSSQQLMESRDNNQQQQALRQRMSLLKPQIISARHRLGLAERQAELATSVMSRFRKLTVTHYISDVEYQQRQIEVTTAQQNVEDQRQALLQINTAYEAAIDGLDHLIAQGKSRNTELARQLQGLQQQLDDLAGQRNFTLTAPISGTVAAVLVKQGQYVRVSEPVMTLVPDDARLQIELYATSQNAGFIQAGQSVSLRFSAFPYQKFGVQRGTLREISETTITPSDLLSVSPIIWKENEGHYRVIIEPEHPFILAYGKKEPLRPGMTLEGDINLDTRHLWEWLTEPLWSLKGKV